MFCVLVLRLGVSSEAENGAVHWFHPFWTEDGKCFEYQFWQGTPSSPIYAWVDGWDNWQLIPEFNPTPGNFAFVTDNQWIAEARQIKQQPTQC